MTGCQKTTLLILLGALVLVFITLFLLLQGKLPAWPRAIPSPLVLHTPTSTATATPTITVSATPTPIASETISPVGTSTPISTATNTPVGTPSPTETPEPTATAAEPPLPTPTLRATVPSEVMDYLEEFVQLAGEVHDMKLLAGTTQIHQSTADALRGVYRRLHEMEIPAGAEEMHLSFIIYVSVLEEKCLCHLFAEIHSADGQGQHYSECETLATNVAMDIMSNRFIPGRESFLKRYGLNALDLGFPY